MLRCWPGVKANSAASAGGTSKVSATASSVSSSIAATRSAWKVADTQWALKWSNGSRQERHTHSDLHAVDPNRLDSRVSSDPHCGQRTDERRARPDRAARRRTPRAWPSPPRSSSPSSTPARARTPRRRAGSRRRSARRPGPSRIVSIAGQPEYVGVICTCTRPWSSSVTSRRIPRSAIVTTGSSGSGRSAAIFQAAPSCVTTSPPGASGAGAASRRAGARGARCAGRAGRRPIAGDDLRDGQRRLDDDRLDPAEHGARAATRVHRRAPVDRARTAPRRTATPRRAPPASGACDSSVPSPSRSVHCRAWSRW